MHKFVQLCAFGRAVETAREHVRTLALEYPIEINMLSYIDSVRRSRTQ